MLKILQVGSDENMVNIHQSHFSDNYQATCLTLSACDLRNDSSHSSYIYLTN